LPLGLVPILAQRIEFLGRFRLHASQFSLRRFLLPGRLCLSGGRVRRVLLGLCAQRLHSFPMLVVHLLDIRG